ncbi:paired immunoglobulin-like type 2 receptor alpha isoform X2 [Tamandua tetradactyla]|uniref:paired immunoglobulin-like type 2 receptor alpha isoform X2 n=1 Tax=Tamandua tetradactyla TaxID=48850 RepID=UPI004053F2B9
MVFSHPHKPLNKHTPSQPLEAGGQSLLWTSARKTPNEPGASNPAAVGITSGALQSQVLRLPQVSPGNACLSSWQPPTMGFPQLLLLLPLMVVPPVAHGGHYEVRQPPQLSGPEGGSVDIPFSFSHPWKLAPRPQVRVFWRRGNFHGEFFYNPSTQFIHKDYRGRLDLNWSESQTQGSLRIRDLRGKDATKYFCRVSLITVQREVRKEEQWQSIEGTELTVTPRHTTVRTTSTRTTSTATTAGLGGSESEKIPASQPLSLGAAVGVALGILVLVSAVLGLIVFVRQKRRKGPQTKAQTPARGSFQDTEERYENIGNNKRQQTDPRLDHKKDGIIYASLDLSSLSSPAAPPSCPPQRSPEAETLYSVLKT